MIIQAIPGSGKTTITRAFPSVFIDSDDMISEFGTPSKELVKQLISDPRRREQVCALIRFNVHIGKIVLTNFDPSDFGIRAGMRLAYRPDQYVQRLKNVGRTDLITEFDEKELTRWAEGYTRKTKVRWLEQDQSVADVLSARFIMDHSFSTIYRPSGDDGEGVPHGGLPKRVRPVTSLFEVM